MLLSQYCILLIIHKCLRYSRNQFDYPLSISVTDAVEKILLLQAFCTSNNQRPNAKHTKLREWLVSNGYMVLTENLSWKYFRSDKINLSDGSGYLEELHHNDQFERQ